jgi:hypothetical protein
MSFITKNNQVSIADPELVEPQYFACAGAEGIFSGLWIRIDLNPDPDPAF